MSADSNISDEGLFEDISNDIGDDDSRATIDGTSTKSSDCNDNDPNHPTDTRVENSNGMHENSISDDVAVDLSTPASQNHPNDEAPSEQASSSPQQPPQEAFQHKAMELNVALESLDSMRRVNLEVEFSNATSSFPVHHDKCTYCQREALHKFVTNPPKPTANANSVMKSESGINIGKVTLDGSRIRRFRSNVGSFFSKTSVSNVGNDDDGKSQATQSCPPTLASPSIKSLSSMESIEEGPNNNSKRANRRNILKKAPRPCLTCGHPTCSSHSSSTFFKNHIPICQPCAYLFELDFLVDVITSTAANTEECRQKVNDMVDCYDRAKLLLVYTAQYADEIASALETHTVRSNKVGAGSSVTGIVSGVAGVVGCGALLFPPVAAVGVPLLIASLVFGGGATAAQTGDAAVKHFSEPNKLAEKMVALHGMVLSLLRITEVLSYGLLKSQCNVNYSVEGYSEGEGGEDEELSQREALKKEINELLEKHGVTTTKAGVGALRNAVTGSIVATEVAAAGGAAAVAGAEAAISTSTLASGASALGRNSRYFGRVGTTAASSARFIPIAGGLLSAACIVVEGKELKRTLSRISEGNPCAKAEQVRSIKEDLDMLPDSSLIADECRHVFEQAQKEKLKKVALAEASSDVEREQKIDGGLAYENVDQGDISDIIDVMETSAQVDAMHASDDKQEQKEDKDLTLGNVNHGNISDMIDVMENSAQVDAMQASAGSDVKQEQKEDGDLTHENMKIF